MSLSFPALSVPLNANSPDPTTLLIDWDEPPGEYDHFEIRLVDALGQTVQTGTIPITDVNPDGTMDFTFDGVEPSTNYQVVLAGQTPDGLVDIGRVNTVTTGWLSDVSTLNKEIFQGRILDFHWGRGAKDVRVAHETISKWEAPYALDAL